MKVPEYSKKGGRGEATLEGIDDNDLRRHMDHTRPLPLPACTHCGHKKTCDFRWDSRRELSKPEGINLQIEAILPDGLGIEKGSLASLANVMRDYLDTREKKVKDADARADVCWCILTHYYDRNFPDLLKSANLTRLRMGFESELLPAMEKK